MKRHVLGAVARAVGDGHAAGGQPGHVHVVDADGHAGHKPHAGICHDVHLGTPDGHELAENRLHAVELLGGGGREDLVRAAHQLKLVLRVKAPRALACVVAHVVDGVEQYLVPLGHGVSSRLASELP